MSFAKACPWAAVGVLLVGSAARGGSGDGQLTNLLDNSAAERMAQTRFRQHVPAAKMGETTLAGAIAIVEGGTGLTIHTDWKALEAAGLKRDEVVNVQGRLLPYGDYLQAVCAYAGVELVLYFKQPAGEFWLTTRWACPVKVGGKAGPQDVFGGSDADAIIRDKLANARGNFVFDKTPFAKVMESFASSGELKVTINWDALTAAGIDKNTPVSVGLKRTAAGKALTTILSEVGGGAAQLGYTVSDGTLVVSTRDDLNSAKYQEVRLFDIRALLGGRVAGTDEYNQRVRAIEDAIKTMVAPDSWRDAGGAVGSLREMGGRLVVNQTHDNQVAILNFLKTMETETFRKRAGLLVH